MAFSLVSIPTRNLRSLLLTNSSSAQAPMWMKESRDLTERCTMNLVSHRIIHVPMTRLSELETEQSHLMPCSATVKLGHRPKRDGTAILPRPSSRVHSRHDSTASHTVTQNIVAVSLALTMKSSQTQLPTSTCWTMWR